MSSRRLQYYYMSVFFKGFKFFFFLTFGEIKMYKYSSCKKNTQLLIFDVEYYISIDGIRYTFFIIKLFTIPTAII